jgi:hypothetical protein
MKYYLIPINETRVYFLNERLKDLLYEKYPNIGELEVNKTTIKYTDESEKKNKRISKIDKKLESFIDKYNIPKYLICYKFDNGSIHEMETNNDVFFSDDLNEYLVSFEETQNYFFQSLYDLRINDFIKKESILNNTNVKKRVKSKKVSK